MNLVKTAIAVLFMATIVSHPSFAKTRVHGGMDGGGGGANSGHLLIKSEIRDLLNQIQIPLAGFFKMLSGVEPSTYGEIYGEPYAELGEKLFAGDRQDAIIQKVFGVKPTILESGSCQAPDGSLHEASAAVSPDRICFSLERLVGRGDLRSSNAKRMLMALAAHEYSHLLGTTEKEASYLQNDIALRIISEGAFGFALRMFESETVDFLRESAMNLQALVQQESSISETCFAMGSIITLISLQSATLINPGDAGVSYFSSHELKKILPRLMKLENYQSFCLNDPETQGSLDQIFGSQQEILLSEYYAAQEVEYLLSDESISIRRIDYGDYDALSAELQDLIMALQEISPAWPAK